MEVHGAAWCTVRTANWILMKYFMSVHGAPWEIVHELSCNSTYILFHGNSWLIMNVHDTPWNWLHSAVWWCMVVHGGAWQCMNYWPNNVVVWAMFVLCNVMSMRVDACRTCSTWLLGSTQRVGSILRRCQCRCHNEQGVILFVSLINCTWWTHLRGFKSWNEVLSERGQKIYEKKKNSNPVWADAYINQEVGLISRIVI